MKSAKEWAEEIVLDAVFAPLDAPPEQPKVRLSDQIKRIQSDAHRAGIVEGLRKAANGMEKTLKLNFNAGANYMHICHVHVGVLRMEAATLEKKEGE